MTQNQNVLSLGGGTEQTPRDLLPMALPLQEPDGAKRHRDGVGL